MVTIANCRDWQECQLLKSKLESVGISVFVPDELSNLDGLMLHFGGFRIQVAEEHAADAGAILEPLRKADEVPEPDTPPKGEPNAPTDRS